MINSLTDVINELELDVYKRCSLEDLRETEKEIDPKVYKKVNEEVAIEDKIQELTTEKVNRRKQPKSGVVVKGISNCLVKFAQCCYAKQIERDGFELHESVDVARVDVDLGQYRRTAG